MSLGIHIYTHSFSGLPNLKFRLRHFFWMPAPIAICVQYLATYIFHSCFKIHIISFLSPPSLSLALPVLLMESSLAPKLAILHSLPLNSMVSHANHYRLHRKHILWTHPFPLTETQFLVSILVSLSPLVPLPVALPPPQSIPCPEARVIFLKQGSNPEWQHTGVVKSVDFRTWVESWIHHLWAVSSWECYSSCFCLTLLRS